MERIFPEIREFRKENFQILDEELGRGGFGIVYKAKTCNRAKDLGEYVAIKVINKNSEKWLKHEVFVRKEIKIHAKAVHHNIIKFHGYYEDKNEIWLILELCSNGSLYDYMRKHGPFKEFNAYKIFKQIVNGLGYLHQKQIIHRDVSMKNILLTKDWKVKIADLGLSTELEKPDDQKTTMVGTPHYMAPEVKKSKGGYNDKADCYSLGCVLCELLVGKAHPVDEDLKHLSPEAQELLKALRKKKPYERICIEAVKKSSFFKKYEKLEEGADKSGDSGNGSSNYCSIPKENVNNFRSRDSGLSSKDSTRNRSRKTSQSVEKSYSIRTQSHERSASADLKIHKKVSQPIYNSTNDAFQINYRNNSKSRENYKNDSGVDSTWKSSKIPSRRFDDSLRDIQIKALASNCSNVDCCVKYSHIEGCCSPHQSIHRSHILNSNYAGGSNKFSEHEKDISPLNAARLKPKRHLLKDRKIVLHISADRKVIVETLKTKKENHVRKRRETERKELYVSEVMIISTDGKKIEIYEVPPYTLLDDYYPPPIPDDPNEIKSYGCKNLPDKKKYELAKKFVDTLRAKTPKLINNGANGKFYVMENSPNPDCRLDFYDGSSVIKKGQVITIIDKQGKKHEVSNDLDLNSNPLGKEFSFEREMCENILKFHESLPSPNFPVIMGMPKTGVRAEKENIAPSSTMSRHNSRSNR